jgi:peptidoglycan/xylan/chitin deacetylase (PgdA/CDA1 family)
MDADPQRPWRSRAWQHAARVAGPIASRLARGRLQILCYHGFAFDDEHRFRAKLFMTGRCFEQRMQWLARRRFAVLPLGEALDRLAGGRLREREIAITIDDGFRGVHAIAAPILASHRFPATVYVTTYYVEHPNPVFRLALQYMAWKSTRRSIELAGLLPGLAGTLPLRGPGAAGGLERLYATAESTLDEPARLALATEFGRRAGVDFDALRRSRNLSLMSPAEIRDLARFGIDVQLHTHRHRLPLAAAEIAREIEDNRAVLAPLCGEAGLRHFCYPSGAWSEAQWAGLAGAGVVSATTCMPGFNRPDQPPLALRRFLDSDDLPVGEFAAETLGVKELWRRLRGRQQLSSTGTAVD